MNTQPPPTIKARIDEAAIVAVGSNLPGRFGPPSRMAQQALADLRRYSTKPPMCSSLYRASPRDCPPDTPEFVNAVAAIWPPAEFTPAALLAVLQKIEAEFGRRRDATRNAPRTLDLDLIAWGPRIVRGTALQLPHPRLTKRKFVLAPLAELAPEWIPPGQSHTVASLLAFLPESDLVELIPDTGIRAE